MQASDVHQVQQRGRSAVHAGQGSPPDAVARGRRRPSGDVHRTQRRGVDLWHHRCVSPRTPNLRPSGEELRKEAARASAWGKRQESGVYTTAYPPQSS